MNNVTLRGRLTADPEMRTYMMKDGSTGTVAAFTLAVPDRTARRDENNNFPADFIRCSCFGKNAEVMESFAMKGTEILITAGGAVLFCALLMIGSLLDDIRRELKEITNQLKRLK